jgi:dihydrofolate reductase
VIGRITRPDPEEELTMSKVILGMSMSLDGIAGGEGDADGMALHEAILGWVFPLRSWRQEQGQPGGEDSVDSRVWAADFARIGPQVIGRTMFDYGYPHWGENPPFHAPVFVVTHRAGDPYRQGRRHELHVRDRWHQGRRRAGPVRRRRERRAGGRRGRLAPAL